VDGVASILAPAEVRPEEIRVPASTLTPAAFSADANWWAANSAGRF